MTERMNAMDSARFLAILFVVIIHAQPFMRVSALGVDMDALGKALNVSARFAVPFFFMASGFLFYRKQGGDDAQGYIKRYVLRLLKLYVVWMAVYLCWDVLSGALRALNGDMPLGEAMRKALGRYTSPLRIYYGPYHLWFLISLAYSALALFLSVRLKKIGLLLAGSFAAYIAGLFGQSYAVFFEIPLQTRDAFFLGIFFMTLGYSVAEKADAGKIPRRPALYLSLFVVFAVLQIVEYEILSRWRAAPVGDYFIATVPACLFLLLGIASRPDRGEITLTGKIGRGAIGIYLIHPLVIQAANLALNMIQKPEIRYTVAWALSFTPLVFLISYLAYAGLSKNAGIRKTAF